MENNICVDVIIVFHLYVIDHMEKLNYLIFVNLYVIKMDIQSYQIIKD